MTDFANDSPTTTVADTHLATLRREPHSRSRSRGAVAVSGAALAASLFVFTASSSAQTMPTSRANTPTPKTRVAGDGPAQRTSAAEENSIRPFTASIPESDLEDLRRRIASTRWPDRETVTDQSQGVKLAKIQELVRYWGTDYDWRKAEAKLNALPQFVTTIDGLDFHFIHVRSRHPDALPLIITHGWPGSVFEMLKVVGPLTDPTAHGGSAEDAFDVVIPSMPGYGFSERPEAAGWGPERMGRAWHELMLRLGYTRYVSQGGDWGSVVADAMGVQAPEGLLGIHVNMPATMPPEITRILAAGGPAPAGLMPDEQRAFEQLDVFFRKGAGYAGVMVTRPQTIGYSLADSPVGLAAWFYDKFASWTHSGGEPERALTRDEMLDDITLTWLTNTGTSGARLYWENDNNNFSAAAQRTADITVPVAVTVFPGEIYRAPKSWTEQAYPTLSYFHEVDEGGHFAAWEQPELFADEMRAAFKSLRVSPPRDADGAAGPISGIMLPTGYRDWRLVSVAREEGDLDDIRAILGNDVAIEAYREGTLPFPDGTIIARLAWSHDASEENNKTFGRAQSFVAGAPKNGVQFMVKDSEKYASSGGWGFAHFDDGKPAGEDTLASCFSCHAAVPDRDLVFTRYSH